MMPIALQRSSAQGKGKEKNLREGDFTLFIPHLVRIQQYDLCTAGLLISKQITAGNAKDARNWGNEQQQKSYQGGREGKKLNQEDKECSHVAICWFCFIANYIL